jgi:hypothetical protein
MPSQVTRESSTDYVQNNQPGYINVSTCVTESVTNIHVDTTLKPHIHRDNSPKHFIWISYMHHPAHGSVLHQFWQTDILADLYKPHNSTVRHRIRYTIPPLMEYSVVACMTYSIAHAPWQRSVQGAMSHDKKKPWCLKQRACLYRLTKIFRYEFESLCWGEGGQLITQPFLKMC